MQFFFKHSAFLQLLLFFAVAEIVIPGCNNSSPNKTVSGSDTAKAASPTVISLLGRNLHQLKLPFYDTCYDTVAIQRLRLPDSLSRFKKFGQFAGKISETNDYLAVLYAIPADVQLPVLHTFNAKGEKISSLKLFIGNCCGENEACSGVSTVLITPGLHIILKDSMQTFERNKKKFDKKKNIKVFKKYEEYKIDSLGNITRVSPNA